MNNYMVLGQQSPVAALLTTLYTAPAQTVVSSITICNRATYPAKVRVSVARAGVIDDVSQYVYYDLPLIGNDTFVATIGISLGATDQVRVYSDTGQVSFSLFGTQVS